ncbi:DUF7575 domain-containing protein [Halopiger goleimassiliensis]|uniref:DUF7575 domain-containing protein n=1 Tax=Halopiger goleimassiliensis TaxID=1293048 RepID=UPI0006779C4A|nr:zinc ribbon domain-containing protein [Halopiger goleimassiliensis]
MRWFRAIAAGGLSMFLPGAGHALLRDWLRALVFAGLYLSAVAIFLPIEEFATVDTMGETFEVLTTDTNAMGQFFLSFIVLFAAVDAAFRALGFPPGANADADADGPTCPECGKELDEDLEFCHWCTARIEPRDGDVPKNE